MENTKWSYSFHATNKQDARAKIQAESANCPVTNIVGAAVDALPADRPLAVSCYGELSDAEDPHTEEDGKPVPVMVGMLMISARLL